MTLLGTALRPAATRVMLLGSGELGKEVAIEKDIIYRHMWPVTFFRVPRTAEGFITTLTDKYCGACETSQRKPKQRKQVMLGSYQ